MPNPWMNASKRGWNVTIQIFRETILNCPPDLWESRLWIDPQNPDSQWTCFWSIAFHTLFFLDLYLEGSLVTFSPPQPFTLEELDPTGKVSPRVYTKEELLSYLDHCQNKCLRIFDSMTDEKASSRCVFPWLDMEYAELQIDNLRHVQEHSAQLSMFLGQQAGIPSRWRS